MSQRADYIPEAFSDEDVSFVEQKQGEIWQVELASSYQKGKLLIDVRERFKAKGEYGKIGGKFSKWIDENLPFSSAYGSKLMSFAELIDKNPESKEFLEGWDVVCSASVNTLCPNVQKPFIKLFRETSLKTADYSVVTELKQDEAVIASNSFEIVKAQSQKRENLLSSREGLKSSIDGMSNPEYFKLNSSISKASKQAHKHKAVFLEAAAKVIQQEQQEIDFDNEEEVRALVKRRLEAKLQKIRDDDALKKARAKAKPSKASKAHQETPQETINPYDLLLYLRRSKDALSGFYERPDEYPEDVQKNVQKSLEELITLIKDNHKVST